MSIEEILDSKLKELKDDITSCVLDVDRGFESAQLSLTHLELEDGRIVEVQIQVTSNEDDFIDEPQP